MIGDFPLKDKIVLVTGGGSGIGLSFVQHALSLNAKVLIGDLKLTPAAEELISSSNNEKKTIVSFVKCDVAKWDELQNLIDSSLKIFGDLPDVYVPCAGIFEPPTSSFWHDNATAEPIPDHYLTLDINITHPIKLTRLAIRALQGRNKRGVVLLVSSIAGLDGYYVKPLYCATKHAIVGFVKSMGFAETQLGVKVVGVCPGITDTPIWSNDLDLKNRLAKNVLTPAHIAARMVKLIEQGEYAGGTVYVERDEKSEVVFKGLDEPGVIKVMGELESFKAIGELVAGEREGEGKAVL
ncbi:hypothetical protein FQN50_003252 [Emmonsiellopsis sp. PD_5]|nr:hypothetical protein FQN50_003252 [Emmonsiellopsis sp. PD_5]